MGRRPVTRTWEIRQVRAWNLKPGDVIGFFDRKKFAELRRTVEAVEPEGHDQIIIRFRRWRPTLGLLVPRTKLIRVRRMSPKKES